MRLGACSRRAERRERASVSGFFLSPFSVGKCEKKSDDGGGYLGNFRIFEGFKKETNTNKDIVMENKLQQLTRKLYDEGLEKGRAEADRKSVV